MDVSNMTTQEIYDALPATPTEAIQLTTMLAHAEHTHINVQRDGDAVRIISKRLGARVVWHLPPTGHQQVQVQDVAILRKVLALIDRHAGDDERLESCSVYMSERVSMAAKAHQDRGWLEHVCVMKYNSGGGMTIGVIQRVPSAEVECHS